MVVDALYVRSQGRDPVLSGEYKGWMISVYRVGRKHEYQAVAECLAEQRDLLQTRRFGGQGAMTRAHYEAKRWVDQEIPA